MIKKGGKIEKRRENDSRSTGAVENKSALFSYVKFNEESDFYV